MTSISYGCEETRTDWKCKCGALTTTTGGECKMHEEQVSPVSNVKLCKDCKHYSDYVFQNCLRVPKGRSKIDGRMKYEGASLQRCVPSFIWWKCGKKGRFWELKE